MAMKLTAARADLRKAHIGGAAGVLVSGLVWLLTGLVWMATGPGKALIVLFIGGMAIAPVAELLSRRWFKAPKASTGKRLELVGLITVPIILAGFYFGWRWYGLESPKTIAVVAVAVGLRYLTFPAMFGGASFWILGAQFIGFGTLALMAWPVPALNLAAIVGLCELATAALLYRVWTGNSAAS
jgi:hypothetical protein